MIQFKSSYLSLSSLFFIFMLFSSQSKSIAQTAYLDALGDLGNHISGNITLSDSQLELTYDILLNHQSDLETDPDAIIKSFDLITQFDDVFEPLFISSNTRNGFRRDFNGDGRNLHRTILLVHQNLFDFSYSQSALNQHEDILNGKYFATSSYFPGHVAPNNDPNAIESATIKCDYLLGPGTQPRATIGNDNVIRPTGCYLAPGTIAEIEVPDEMVGKGILIRVGAHHWDLKNKSNLKRMDRVTLTFEINEKVTKIANPLGGGIYIDIPLGINEGLQEIQLKNVVRSPFFSMKTAHKTSLEDWVNIERNRAAPWTDFETDRFMMQVPTSWIYNFDDPQSLLESWDKSMDIVSDLLGRPHVVDRHKNYLQFDVIIRGGAYHPGYPMSNTPYNPNAATDGTPNHNILRGPQFGQDIHFHELGHEVGISKFVGEVEAIVNFLYVPVLNKGFGYELNEAFSQSFGPSYGQYVSKDNAVRTKLVAPTFELGQPRNTCNCTKDEVRYQHRGYAHYVDIVELFGWEALEQFFYDESVAADTGNTFPVNNQPQDDRIFRMSKAAGVDLRPLFHFWGIVPHDQEALVTLMQQNHLELPLCIKEKLHDYRDLIPKSQDEFIAMAEELHPGFQDYTGTQFDFGSGWYQVNALTYDEARAQRIEAALSDIIVYYYGSDCFNETSFQTADFDLNSFYCKNEALISLPEISLNNIWGTWSSEMITTEEVGSYQYTFTPNLDQCAKDFVLDVNITEAMPPFITASDLVACSGESIQLNTTDNYDSYSWQIDGMEIGNSGSIDVNSSANVNLTIVDENGCSAESTISLTVYEPLILQVNTDDPLCYGDYGSATFSAIGGSGNGISYSMDGADLSPGTYTVSVIDDAGCQNATDFTIEEVEEIKPFIEGVSIICAEEFASVYSVNSYSAYSWIVDGIEIANTANVEVNQTTDLLLIVTDDNGCTGQETFAVEAFTPISIDINTLPPICYGDVGSAEFNVLGGAGGPYIYSMEGNNLSPGAYSLTVTDNYGCQGTAEFIIEEAEEIRLVIEGASIVCSGESATVSTQESYDFYSWMIDGVQVGSMPSLTITESESILLTVTDDNGCTAEELFTVKVLEPLSVAININNPLCFGENGSVDFTTSGGSGQGYSYSMEGDNLSPGSYTVSVTDDLGCMATATFTIDEAEEIIPVIEGLNTICSGEFTDLSTQENYHSYSWTVNGITVSDLPSLSINENADIMLTVTNQNGCSAQQSFTVDVLDPIQVEATITQPLCYGETGSAIFSASGGSEQGYQFSMSGDLLSAGTYTVSVTDDYNCQSSFEFEILQPEPLTIELENSDFIAFGGTPPYSIVLDTIDAIITLTLEDANGCMLTEEFIISSNNNLDLSKAIKLFPNPTAGVLNIEYGDQGENIKEIQLYLSNGKFIKKYVKPDQIATRDFENGIYLLKIIAKDNSFASFKVAVLR